MVAVGPKGRMKVKRSRKSRTEKEKLADALVRVKKKLGIAETASMKAKWENLSTGRGGKDRLVGNGLISSMLELGLSYIEIQSFFGCGKVWICRVKNPGAYTRTEEPDVAR